MKKKTGIILAVLGAIAIIAGVVKAFCITLNVARKPASVSIIGGADGPTKVFVAGKLGTSVGGLFFVGTLCLIIAIVLLLKKKR